MESAITFICGCSKKPHTDSITRNWENIITVFFFLSGLDLINEKAMLIQLVLSGKTYNSIIIVYSKKKAVKR